MELLGKTDVHPQGFLDALTLGELTLAQLRSSRVNNEFLKMKPEDIVRGGVSKNSKIFYVDDLCILTDDKMKTTDDEYWEKVRERGQGWGIAGDAGWEGWKRIFVYKPRQPSNSNKNWFLEVFAAFEGNGYVKPLYACYVFEAYNCNPPPKCVSQVSAAHADNPFTIQENPVEVESLARKLEAMATNAKLLPFGYGEHGSMEERQILQFLFPSIGVDKSLRAEVWKSGKFSRIKARRPDGSEICWSLCNHCGMVYKGSTLPAGLEKHKCDCSCRLAPNS